MEIDKPTYDKVFIMQYENKKIKIYNKYKKKMNKLSDKLHQLEELKQEKKLEYAMCPKFVLLMEIKELLQNIAYLKKKIQENKIVYNNK